MALVGTVREPTTDIPLQKPTLSGGKLSLTLGIAFVVLASSVKLTGAAPAIPFNLMVFVVRCVPIAVVIACWNGRFDKTNSWWGLAGALAFGVVVTWLNRWPALWLPLAAASIIVMPQAIDKHTLVRLGSLMFATLLGYGAVWNANILAARATTGRSWDGWFRSIDLAVYKVIGVGDGTYRDLFPLLHSRWVTELLSQAYLMIMVELFVALVLTARQSSRTAEGLLRTIFCGYAVGLMIFMVAPSVGPCIAFPAAIDFGALPSQGSIVMRAMIDGFADLAGGVDRPVIAYFVAFPSLHVLLAIVLQWHLRPFRSASLVFASVNLLVICSTVILGFHYLIDVAGAALVAPVVLLVSDPSFRLAFRRSPISIVGNVKS